MAAKKKINKTENSLVDQVKQKLEKTEIHSTQQAVDKSSRKPKKSLQTISNSSKSMATKKVIDKSASEVNVVTKQKKRKHSVSSKDDDDDDDDDILSNKLKSMSASSVNSNYMLWGLASVQEPKEDSSSDDEDKVTQGEQKKRRKRSRLEREREEAAQEATVRAAELSRVSGPRVPESEHDYKELLLSNSSCSATWIQYISFLLASGDHERARAVARSGLAKIPCEEQQERVNLWTVLLRLDVQYCPTASVAEDTLHEATTKCDPYTMLCNMANIYQENDMPEKAEAIYRRLTKKFYAELEAWVKFGQFYFTTGRLQDARETLTKALVVLKNKTGVDVTNRFAQMEMKYGDRVKACSMFESLLAHYPKRLDVWNVFVDLLVKNKDFEKARTVFTRMRALPIRFNKKYTVLRKWRDFEMIHGDEQSKRAILKIVEDFSEENLS